MTDETRTWLGRTVPVPEGYSPDLLTPVPRYRAREALPSDSPTWDDGADAWTGWELSWLNADGWPESAVLRLEVPADSPCLVESKSLKLYLSGLNHHRLADRATVCQLLTEDLGKALGATPAIDLVSPDDESLRSTPPPGQCLEAGVSPGETAAWPEGPEAGRLETDPIHPVSETLHTRLFRSHCPVTGQPDWATVVVEYAGARIAPLSLLRYLLSYRRHAAFHEACVERVFTDIWAQCRPERLRVTARFLRRGGLDINPWRARGRWTADPPGRMPRQ